MKSLSICSLFAEVLLTIDGTRAHIMRRSSRTLLSHAEPLRAGQLELEPEPEPEVELPMRRRILALALASRAASPIKSDDPAVSSAVNISSSTQLFVDDFLVQNSSGLTRKMHSPDCSHIAVTADAPVRSQAIRALVD